MTCRCPSPACPVDPAVLSNSNRIRLARLSVERRLDAIALAERWWGDDAKLADTWDNFHADAWARITSALRAQDAQATFDALHDAIDDGLTDAALGQIEDEEFELNVGQQRAAA